MNAQLAKAINEQARLELESAYLYLAMSMKLQETPFTGYSHWLLKQYEEERSHAFKLMKFLIERGVPVVLGDIHAPKSVSSNPITIAKEVLAHEQLVTDYINKLYELSRKVKDYPAEIMLQWFITEQVEEEASAQEIIDKLQMVGSAGPARYALDRELARRE